MPSDGASDGAARRDASPVGDASGSSSGGGAPTDARADAGTGGDAAPLGASVLQFHNHATRDGVYVDSLLTAAAAGRMHLDQTFTATVDGNVYAQPLYVENGPGGHGAFIVVTENNNVYAFDETGAQIWKTSLGAPAAAADNCGNIKPLGVTGTPAIDLNHRAVYLDAALPGTTTTNMREHAIHALSIDTGSELPGWPVLGSTVTGTLGADVGSMAFVANPQNERGALLIVGNTLYVPFGGHAGDCADSTGNEYHGWIIGIPLDDPTAATGFVTQASQAGIWAVGGLASDGVNVFASTGNASSGQNCPSPPPMSPPPGWMQQEAILRFQPGPVWSGRSVDYWAPDDWPCLDNADLDVGGSNPVLVDVPGSPPLQLVAAHGKNGTIYLIDRNNLGGVGQQLATVQLNSGAIIMSPISYTTAQGTYLVFYVDVPQAANCPSGSGNLVAMKIISGSQLTVAQVWCADEQGQGSPIYSTSDGVHDPLVWAIGGESSNQLRAWNADTGAVVFDGGTSADVVPGFHHFSTVISVKGRIFAGADGRLVAFAPQ